MILTLPSWLTVDYQRPNSRLPCDLGMTRSQPVIFFSTTFLVIRVIRQSGFYTRPGQTE